ATQHDAILASVSHLPHLLAFAYMAQVASADDARCRLDHAGSGFRDFSRIAGSSPEMWRDVLLSNRDAVLHELDRVQTVLADMAELLRKGDAKGLESLLQVASDARRGWTQE